MNKLPLPKIYPHTQPYWNGAQEGRLILPYCCRCKSFFFYPRVCCPACYSKEIEHKEVERKGTIETFSTLYRPPFEAFASKIPYTLGMIRTCVGVLIFMEIRGDREKIKIGQEGEILFEKRENFALPFFQV